MAMEQRELTAEEWAWFEGLGVAEQHAIAESALAAGTTITLQVRAAWRSLSDNREIGGLDGSEECPICGVTLAERAKVNPANPFNCDCDNWAWSRYYHEQGVAARSRYEARARYLSERHEAEQAQYAKMARLHSEGAVLRERAARRKAADDLEMGMSPAVVMEELRRGVYLLEPDEFLRRGAMPMEDEAWERYLASANRRRTMASTAPERGFNPLCKQGRRKHDWSYDEVYERGADRGWRICLACGKDEVYADGADWGKCAGGHLRLPENLTRREDGRTACLAD